MTTYQWDAPNSVGNWSDQDNWINSADGNTDEGVPGPGDTAYLNESGSITTGDATVGTLYAFRTELMGGITVTGDLYGGIFEGGVISANFFEGGTIDSGATLSAPTVDGVVLMSGSVSAGLVDDCSLYGGTLSATTIENGEFYSGSATAHDLAEADISGGFVSVSIISSTDPKDYTTFIRVSSGGSLKAGEMVIDHGVSFPAQLYIAGGSLVVTGKSQANGDVSGFAYVGIGSGEMDLRGGLTLSDDAELNNGSSGSGGTLNLLSLTAAEAGSGMVELSGGRTSVTSDLILGEAGQGVLSVVSGATLSVGGDLEVASEAAGSGSAVVSGDGAEVSVQGDAGVGVSGSASWMLAGGATMVVSGGFEIGAEAGGTGKATVSGENTELTLGASGLTVGGSGSGSLAIGGGGTIDDSGGALTLGEVAGAKGTLTATGASTALEIGGEAMIGASGQGALTLTGVAAEIDGDLTLGEASGAKGSLKLTGGALALTGDLTIGEKGQGSVTVAAGGTLGSGGGVGEVVVGGATGGKGSLSVTGAGSLLESEGLTVGEGGLGSLAISKDAVVQTTGDATIGDTAAGEVQKASLTSGAAWRIGDGLTVGGGGIAEVTVGAGAGLAAASGLVLGESAGAAGALTVTGSMGSGSSASASTLSWGDALEVGDAGSGLLKIAGGGVASGATLEIGVKSGATGSVSVAGSGSVLSGVSLAVGGTHAAAGGSGVLTLGAGGSARLGSTVAWAGGEILDNGGTVRLGPVEDLGLIKATKGVVSAVGAFIGLGAVAVGSGGRFVLDAAGATTANRVRLTAATGAFSLTGGSGADLFQMSVADLAASDVIAGGAGVDTLQFTTSGVIAAGAFAKVSGIDTLRLAKGGDNRLALSESVVAGSDKDRLTIAGGTGTDVVNATAVSSGAVVFNGADTAKTVLIAGAGVISATGGSGADLFEIAIANLTSADRIVGGGGEDVLAFTTAGAVAATALARVSGVEVIELASGTNSLTLSEPLAVHAGGMLTVEGAVGATKVNAASLAMSSTLVFEGAGGQDSVHGGKGDNLYDFDATGSSTLAITNSYAGGSAAHGALAFGSSLSDEDLWLKRSGANLVLEVIGTKEEVTISGWFSANPSAKVAEITAAGLELDAGVQRLVAAMASYQKAHPSFDPTAMGATMPTTSAIQTAIISAWHH